jgi:hypothetical protein
VAGVTAPVCAPPASPPAFPSALDGEAGVAGVTAPVCAPPASPPAFDASTDSIPAKVNPMTNANTNSFFTFSHSITLTHFICRIDYDISR